MGGRYPSSPALIFFGIFETLKIKIMGLITQNEKSVRYDSLEF